MTNCVIVGDCGGCKYAIAVATAAGNPRRGVVGGAAAAADDAAIQPGAGPAPYAANAWGRSAVAAAAAAAANHDAAHAHHVSSGRRQASVDVATRRSCPLAATTPATVSAHPEEASAAAAAPKAPLRATPTTGQRSQAGACDGAQGIGRERRTGRGELITEDRQTRNVQHLTTRNLNLVALLILID